MVRGRHRTPARDQRGMALSTPVALASTALVVVAGVGLLATAPPPNPVSAPRAPSPSSPAPTATPTSAAPTPKAQERKPQRPRVRRAGVYVEVYNNSGISGLAGRTAARATRAGWQVVGADNWYGTIPASTVYFPPRLREEARLLGRDLGVRRLMPAVAPMRLDRLTVILTADRAR